MFACLSQSEESNTEIEKPAFNCKEIGTFFFLSWVKKSERIVSHTHNPNTRLRQQGHKFYVRWGNIENSKPVCLKKKKKNHEYKKNTVF